MMHKDIQHDPQIEEIWRAYLTTGKLPEGVSQPWYERPPIRALARRLPDDPRCQMCYYPFGGLGGKLVRTFLQLEPSKMNPHLCNICERFAEEHLGGAELEVSLLFADIRGSTPLAATMKPYDFSRLINRFYKETTNIIFEHGGMVEKLVGDEVAAFFTPAFVENQNHAHAAVKAGQEILTATGHEGADKPWVPVGVGIHTGVAYVGAVGQPGKNIDIAVLGDNVNIASRLAGQAKAGEIVFSDDTLRKAGLDNSDLEFRSLTLKGKGDPIDTWIYRSGAG